MTYVFRLKGSSYLCHPDTGELCQFRSELEAYAYAESRGIEGEAIRLSQSSYKHQKPCVNMTYMEAIPVHIVNRVI